ncbi:ATP-binding cassette domain-containing protein [Paractinoplanes lichenicola]|uniref:ATP-binding cassette domain-containing protein n=1 Tax=Paractinoplanes lichenicola TaxID=2802976 RepID=A0ABS1VYK0_9ACTN|nr:ATP-binding cassette domain-containing protein [Actinoplanes lichenicola]MBL7259571.1 ATP-binding cassette domain-containing protein [Actinoplanes lichenicola]
MSMRVEFDRASVTRDGRRILHETTLTLEPGTLTVVAGAAGSGKTTLLDLAAGLAPTAGVVKFDGTSVRDLAADSFPRGVTVVTATPFLVAPSIRQNLALGAAYEETALWQALRVAAIEDLPDGLDAAVVDPSLRPRLGLARALLRRPRLLLLDDPLAALDERTERQVLESLAALDITVLATTTRPAVAEAAHQAALLEAGHLTPISTPSRPTYAAA